MQTSAYLNEEIKFDVGASKITAGIYREMLSCMAKQLDAKFRGRNYGGYLQFMFGDIFTEPIKKGDDLGTSDLFAFMMQLLTYSVFIPYSIFHNAGEIKTRQGDDWTNYRFLFDPEGGRMEIFQKTSLKTGSKVKYVIVPFAHDYREATREFLENNVEAWD